MLALGQAGTIEKVAVKNDHARLSKLIRTEPGSKHALNVTMALIRTPPHTAFHVSYP